jgi:hypothetical protein
MEVFFVETKNNCPVAIVDKFYSSEELRLAKEELTSLYEVSKLGIFENTGVAKDDDGNARQKSNSLFLDDLFAKDRSLSKILSVNRKLFSCVQLQEVLLQKSLFYNYIYNSNKDNTLINFYTLNDFYKEHKDRTCFTALTFFKLQDFEGGDLLFTEHNIRIQPLENRIVIFPGFMYHKAEEVRNGVRVSMAQFINTV